MRLRLAKVVSRVIPHLPVKRLCVLVTLNQLAGDGLSLTESDKRCHFHPFFMVLRFFLMFVGGGVERLEHGQQSADFQLNSSKKIFF